MLGVGFFYVIRNPAIGFLSLVVAIVFILVAKAIADPTNALPQLVNDYADKLTPTQEGQLIAELRAVERMAGKPQMVVVLPVTLGGKDVADYAGKLARASKIGQIGKDNGILLVVAPAERKIRLEIGYGLEGVIPDVRAAQIISGMKPFLKKGNEDWYGAIHHAISQVRANLKE